VPTPSELFDEVVAASGLNNLIAPFAVSRMLVGADVDPQALTRETLASAVPRLEEGLAVYLRGDELLRAVTAIRRLAGQP
jgi:hypothetical protein